MENWRDVVNYKGYYQVSNLGRVKSLARKGVLNDRILKPGINTHGYYKVVLCKNSKHKARTVHQLVAESFLNHKPDGYKIVVDHIDNQPLNNRVENLQLISQRENSSKDRTNGSSKYVGVSFHKAAQKWMARIAINGKLKHLGYFTTELEALVAYQKALGKVLANEKAQDEGKPLPFTLDDIVQPRIQSSKFKGVTFNKAAQKWMANITIQGKQKHLGYFTDELEASEAHQIELNKILIQAR